MCASVVFHPMSAADGDAPKNKKIQLRGLNRYQIGLLLNIYNKNIIDSPKGPTTPAKAMQFVVALFGMGISEEEAKKIIHCFSEKNLKFLSFREFLEFFDWFFLDEEARICQKLYSIIDHGQGGSVSDRDLDSLRLSAIRKGFLQYILSSMESKTWRQLFKEANILQMPDPHYSPLDLTKNVRIDIQFTLTIGCVLGTSDFEYVGLDADLPSLDIFVKVEFCGKEYRTKVFPAKQSPSIGESFDISVQTDEKLTLSFLDATWWLQQRKVTITVYAVHFIDVKVAYHTLGVAKIPLIALLSGRGQRISFGVNAEPITPASPIRLLLSVVCPQGANEIAINSEPLDRLIIEKYFKNIKASITGIYKDDENNAWCRIMDCYTQALQKCPAREYQAFGFNEYNQAYLLCSFISNSPKYIERKFLEPACSGNVKLVDWLAYCISLHGESIYSQGSQEIMQIRSLPAIEAMLTTANVHISEMERAVLLCSILRSCNENAYVCVGDFQWQRCICVCVQAESNLMRDKVQAIDCAHHMYSLEDFHGKAEPVSRIDERLRGQLHVRLAKWVNPIFLAINPPAQDTENDEMFSLYTEPEAGRDESKGKKKWIMIPISGWHGDAPPRGLQVATLFNEKRMLFYTGKEYAIQSILGELPNLEGGSIEGELQKNWLRFEVSQKNKVNVYKPSSYLEWIRDVDLPDKDMTVARVNMWLFEMIRDWIMSLVKGNDPETYVPAIFKCLYRLLVNLKTENTTPSIKQLVEVYGKVRPQLGPNERPELSPVLGALALANDMIQRTTDSWSSMSVHFALAAVCWWIYYQTCASDLGKPNEKEKKIFADIVLPQSRLNDLVEGNDEFIGHALMSTDIKKNVTVLDCDFNSWVRQARVLCLGREMKANSSLAFRPEKRRKLRQIAEAKLGKEIDKTGKELCPEPPGTNLQREESPMHWVNIWQKLVGAKLPQDYAGRNGSQPEWKATIGKLSTEKTLKESLKTTEAITEENVSKMISTVWANPDGIYEFLPMGFELVRLVALAMFPDLATIPWSDVYGLYLGKDFADKVRDGKDPAGRFVKPWLLLMSQELHSANKEKINFRDWLITKLRLKHWERKVMQLYGGNRRTNLRIEDVIPQFPDSSSEKMETEPQVPDKEKDGSIERKRAIRLVPDRKVAKRRAGLFIDGIELSKVMKVELADRLVHLGIVNRKTGDSVITFHCPSEAEFSSKLWAGPPESTERKQASNEELRNSAFRLYCAPAPEEKKVPPDFFKKACESFLTQHIQRELIELESEFIANGRIDDRPGGRYSELKREVARLIGAITDPTFVSSRVPRFMFRLTKHNTTDPKLLADELMRSGIMTSALGCESIYLVVQPFKYPLFAETAWVALVFVYPVPVPINNK